jgi:hypothetical protein
MKKHNVVLQSIITIVTFLIITSTLKAYSAPFLVCDPQAGVTTYQLTGPAWVPATTSAQVDGSIKMDVSSAVVGQNSLTVAACAGDVLWGLRCSVAVPFAFTRPSNPSTPVNIRLQP